jgi:hypothetical protein
VEVKRAGRYWNSGGVWLGVLNMGMEISTPVIPPVASGLPTICGYRAKWLSAFRLVCSRVRREAREEAKAGRSAAPATGWAGVLRRTGPDLWYALRVVEGGFCF